MIRERNTCHPPSSRRFSPQLLSCSVISRSPVHRSKCSTGGDPSRPVLILQAPPTRRLPPSNHCAHRVFLVNLPSQTMDSPIALLGGRVWPTVLPLFNILRSIVPQYIQFWFQQISCLLAVSTCPWITPLTPIGFPDSGNGLWYTSPGTRWAQELLPIGNGHLAGMISFIVIASYLKRLHPAAMVPGGTIQESIQLNIESLWSGGPFQDPVCHHQPIVITSRAYRYDLQTYNGGNDLRSQRTKLAWAMQGIREAIFASPNGTVDSESSFLLLWIF